MQGANGTLGEPGLQKENDLSAPNIPVLTRPSVNDMYLNNSANLYFTYNTPDDIGIAGFKEFEYMITGDTYSPAVYRTTTNRINITSPQECFPYRLMIRAIDYNNNMSDYAISKSILYDITTPNIISGTSFAIGNPDTSQLIIGWNNTSEPNVAICKVSGMGGFYLRITDSITTISDTFYFFTEYNSGLPTGNLTISTVSFPTNLFDTSTISDLTGPAFNLSLTMKNPGNPHKLEISAFDRAGNYTAILTLNVP
jgi:hypothetical protein